MRDHYFIDDMGNRLAVTEMLTVDIIEALDYGIEIIDDEGGFSTKQNVRERLQIELDIRAAG